MAEIDSAALLRIASASHDRGALHAIETLRGLRKRHPVRTFLTLGRYPIDLLEAVVMDSIAHEYDAVAAETEGP